MKRATEKTFETARAALDVLLDYIGNNATHDADVLTSAYRLKNFIELMEIETGEE